ncbi:MAG: ABC transporter ATP-binding protein [Xanthomonadaceae bacterium]|nr:ABC transporter ATP-binding protein [Xanthomonadaceae bacterium]
MTHGAPLPLLETRELSVGIGGKSVCRGLDLRLQAGQCLGILGQNGVGKTTLLHTLAGLRPAESGSILLRGAPLEQLSRRRVAQQVGLLMQEHEDPFPALVLETALVGRHPHIEFWQWESASDIRVARAALDAVDLSELETRSVNTLSGGERQRLGLATVITQDPDVFLLDEPTNHLDLQHEIDLLRMLVRFAREGGKGVAMTLHDINLAARFCDRLLLMFGDGETLLGATADILTADNLHRLFGVPVAAVQWDGGTVYVPQ